MYGAKVPIMAFHWPWDLKEADWMGRGKGVDEGEANNPSRFGVLYGIVYQNPNVMASLLSFDRAYDFQKFDGAELIFLKGPLFE